MDKVVQQNAANAEESSSASEQMKAQTGTINARNELGTLIGGTATPVKSTVRTGSRRAAAAGRKKLEPGAKPPQKKSARRPDDVTPLEETEFKDF
jgi:methyl-accepting chemotaxis protein